MCNIDLHCRRRSPVIGTGRRPRIITVDPSNPCPVKAVLTTEQTAARSKTELEREDINPEDVVKVFHSSTDRGRKCKVASVNTPRKAKTSNKGKKRSNTTNKGKKSKTSSTQFMKAITIFSK